MSENNNEPKKPTPATKGEAKVDDENVLDKFEEIKNRYEETITARDKEIAELKEQLKAKDGEVDKTISKLNDEVNSKLEQAEELNQLRANVQELLKDKAEAIVDKYIQEGKVLPAQRDTALNLCLTNQDTFISLYENAPRLVDTTREPVSQRGTGDVDKLANYFKQQ